MWWGCVASRGMVLMTVSQWDSAPWVTCGGQWASHYLSTVVEGRHHQMIRPQRERKRERLRVCSCCEKCSSIDLCSHAGCAVTVHDCRRRRGGTLSKLD